MSTRATIAVRRTEGMYDAVYLHYDGYPKHTGVRLMQHYANQTDAQTLVRSGELRSLDRVTGEPEHFPDSRPTAMLPTNASLIEFAKNCGAKYVYIFEDGVWACLKF